MSSPRMGIVDVMVKIQDDWKQPSSLSHWPGGFHGCPPILMIDSSSHQENAESASTKLEVLGMMGVPYKRFEALPASPKHVEARRITAEYFFFPH